MGVWCVGNIREGEEEPTEEEMEPVRDRQAGRPARKEEGGMVMMMVWLLLLLVMDGRTRLV